MQEQENRQRELREKLAQAKISNVQGLQDPDSIFGPVPDYVERRRPITRLFFSVYDNLGTLIVINIFTFLLTLPLLYVLLMLNNIASDAYKRHLPSSAIIPYLPLLIVGLIAPPAWAAASSYCAKVVEEQMHAVSGYWSDYRTFLGRSIVLAVGQWVLGVALIYATSWYLGQRVFAFKLVGIVALYLFFFWALSSLYLWPLMVRGYPWRSVLRNSAVLVVSAPARTIGIMVVLLILSAILIVSGVGAVVLLFSLWAMLPNQALVLTRERLEARSARRGA